MATQTIRVVAPLAAGSYTVNVQVDGSNTNAFTGRTLTAESITGFWTFTVTNATAGLYAFQILNGSSAVVAYGWFYSASNLTVTIQDSNSRDDALVRNVSLPDVHGDVQSSYLILNNFIDVDGNSDTVFRSWMGLASANLDTQLSAISSGITGIDSVTDKLDTALVQDGLVWQFTTNALENASGSVVVHPGYASWAEKIAGQALDVFHNEAGGLGPIRVQRRTGTTAIAEDVDLTELTGLYFLVVNYLLEEVYTTTSVTISGTENSQFTVPVTTELTGTVTNETKEEWHYWSLRDETDTVISTGRLRVRPA